MKYWRNGNYGLTKKGVEVYSFEVAGDRFASPGILPLNQSVRKSQPMRIRDFDIIPHGDYNRLPLELREILDENNLTPEILNKQTQLLWGQGPALYEIRFEDGKRKKYFIEDPEIQSWLNDWDYQDYLLKSTVEYRHMNGHFTQYRRNKGVRIGNKPFIRDLVHKSCVFSRLEWPDAANNIKHIIVGDYDRPWSGMVAYPIFNRFDPFRYSISMQYSNMYSFALDNEYSRPSFNGSINWIRLSSSISKLLMNFNENAAAIKYHIKSPAIYWQRKAEELRSNCELKGQEYSNEMLEDLKDETFKAFTEALSGISRVGKMITTETIYDELGDKYVGWEVEVLDQKVKDFIDAQINISKRAGFETTAGLGLHPALSNITHEGNLPSGSEQLYAFKLYLSTGVDIPESIVCKDINQAIAANFPGKKHIKLGFYHDNVLVEENTNPDDRIKNQ